MTTWLIRGTAAALPLSQDVGLTRRTTTVPVRPMEFQKYAEVPKQQREVMMAEFRNKKEKESGAAR